MNERDPKFIVGSRPVNRRTAVRPAAPAPSPVARQRLRANQVRNRLGAPLAEQLMAPIRQHRVAPSRLAIVGGIVAATGGLGLFLAWLQASVALAAASTAGVAGGLFLARPRASAADAALMAAAPSPLFDPACVAALDRALQPLAAELPPDLVQPLVDIKQLIVRLARHPAAQAVDEHFRPEDRMYVNECLRRYLPDSLQAYLAVPSAQRTLPLADGQTAHGLLLGQLTLLHQELQAREAKLARSASEALLRQQRFLQAKSGG